MMPFLALLNFLPLLDIHEKKKSKPQKLQKVSKGPKRRIRGGKRVL